MASACLGILCGRNGICTGKLQKPNCGIFFFFLLGSNVGLKTLRESHRGQRSPHMDTCLKIIYMQWPVQHKITWSISLHKIVKLESYVVFVNGIGIIYIIMGFEFFKTTWQFTSSRPTGEVLLWISLTLVSDLDLLFHSFTLFGQAHPGSFPFWIIQKQLIRDLNYSCKFSFPIPYKMT